MSDSIDAPPLALTQLSDDERLFANSVYEFAHREVRPLVREMDEHAANLTFGGPNFSTLYMTAGTSVYGIDTSARGLVPGSR